MSHIPATAIADQAHKHLGEPGPNNTCVSNGMERWTRELGLPTLGTDSVTEARRLARAGHNGWRYHEGTDGIGRGNFGDWDPEVLGDADDRHVCVVDRVEGGRFRGIGSGTPSGTVAYQPASGGTNPLGVLVGYFVAPTETVPAAAPVAPAKAPAAATKPAAKPAAAPTGSGTVYTVQRGDYLDRIAAQHRTTRAAILRANPPLASHRSADFHIARANLVVIGQKIRIP